MRAADTLINRLGDRDIGQIQLSDVPGSGLAPKPFLGQGQSHRCVCDDGRFADIAGR